MKYTVTGTAPADIYGSLVKEGDEITLSKKRAANHLLKGHIVAAEAKAEETADASNSADQPVAFEQPMGEDAAAPATATEKPKRGPRD